MITIVKFFTREKLNAREAEKRRPATPSMTRNRYPGNLTESSNFTSVVATKSNINKIPIPRMRSADTCELLDAIAKIR